MSKELIIKYKFTNDQAIEPRKSTKDSAAHDIFAADDKTLQPGSCDTISLELNIGNT